MSVIAARQIQNENKDVNNLWKYPDGYYNPGWTMGEMLIPIKYWKIMRFSSAGPGGNDANVTGSYTSNSISGRYAGGYVCSVFLDLNPGKYTMSFTSHYNGYGYIWFNQYVVRDNCALYDGHGNTFRNTFHSGFNQFEFQVIDGCVAMMQFKDQLDKPEWITLSDFAIKE